MSTSLQQEIQEVISEIVHLDRVSEQLKITRNELDQTNSQIILLDSRLNKELKDIERLEGLSTKAIFYKILGSREEQLEKERQVFLELSLKEEDLKNSIKILEYEINILEAKLSSSDVLKMRLENLKFQREEEIVKSDPRLKNELLGISEKLEHNYQFKKELEEAIEVGELCRNLSGQIITQLSQVRNWGKWPASGRKRPMRYALRRDAIDKARHLAYQVRHHLNLFEKELADVGKQITFSSDTSKFAQFSDFFFNNLITDWIMQQQLTHAIGSANKLSNQLSSCAEELLQTKQIISNEIIQLNNRRNLILLS